MQNQFILKEKVLYKSQYDGSWKEGIISRFTQEGIITCASIWETPADSHRFCNHIPLNDMYIKKIVI